MRPLWGDCAGVDRLAAQRPCSARQRRGPRPCCGNPHRFRVLRSTTPRSHSATVLSQHGGERRLPGPLSNAASRANLRRQRPISASEGCSARALALPLPPTSHLLARILRATGLDGSPMRIRSVGSACSISGSIGSMSTFFVRPGFGPSLRSVGSLRSPLGSARGSMSLLHPSASANVSLATPGGSAPSCPLPSRPRNAAGHPIPTWEELLGQR